MYFSAYLYLVLYLVYFRFQSDLTKLCSKPEVLAHHLTAIELERLSYIGPEEFLQFWDRPAKHLVAYEAWTGRLTSLVVTEVLRVAMESLYAVLLHKVFVQDGYMGF